MDYTRRDFLNAITTATLGAVGASFFPSVRKISPDDFAVIPEGGRIVFQGDSITDAGRNRQELSPNSGLGHGYVFLDAAKLRHKLADRDVKCYNRGISGNKVFQLADRWERDCLELNPDLLSILVGVNDFWHTIDFSYEGTVETYEQDFRSLLQRTKENLPHVKLIIGEPFAVKEGSAITEQWFPVFDRYREAARNIARDFEAAFIPYQSIFNAAGEKTSSTYWTADGVHPTLAGAHLMAKAWLETVKRM